MRIILLTAILVSSVMVLLFVTGGEVIHVSRILPFCSGHGIDRSYELGGLAMLGLFIWGLYRLRNNNRRDDE